MNIMYIVIPSSNLKQSIDKAISTFVFLALITIISLSVFNFHPKFNTRNNAKKTSLINLPDTSLTKAGDESCLVTINSYIYDISDIEDDDVINTLGCGTDVSDLYNQASPGSKIKEISLEQYLVATDSSVK